ncbi:unnamed protein product [Cunninghamella blakesleeana]
MDTLPNEILYQILSYLPQKYTVSVCSVVCKKWSNLITQPSFFTTIHLYSKWYSERYIRKIKEKETMEGDSFINYVKNVRLYFTPDEYGDIWYITKIPNLLSIEGLSHNYSLATSTSCEYVYFRLLQPTAFSYGRHDKEWISKFNTIKHGLKSLKIYMPYELIHYDSKQEQGEEQDDSIQLKFIGHKKGNIISTQSNFSKKTPIKMLQLSTTTKLVNLTNLYINFKCNYNRDYIINECTFENIHHTCPSLKSLTLEEFNMNIVDYDDDLNEYDLIYNKTTYEPAYQLKELNIHFSKFGDSCCFSYFGEKYPNIESISFDLWKQKMEIEYVPIFEEAIINMLLQFPLLKKVSFLPLTRDGDHNWLHLLFVTWLNQHPNRLTHYDYIYNSVLDVSFKRKKISEYICNNRKQEKSLLSQQLLIQPEPFLFNYLTSLSVTIYNAVQYASTYLLMNSHASVVSSVLKNLIIEGYSSNGRKHSYFFDWLDIFPNLRSLSFRNFDLLGDIEFFDRNNDNYYDDIAYLNDEDYQNVHKLHRLIEQRKQWQLLKNIQDYQFTDIAALYKLESLEIWHCRSWRHNDLNDFFNQCQQLKVLRFEYSTLVDPSCTNGKDLQFDLSHAYLELLYIKNLFYEKIPQDLTRCLNNLYIHKSATGGKSIFPNIRTNYTSDDNFDLHIKCKFVDGVFLN